VKNISPSLILPSLTYDHGIKDVISTSAEHVRYVHAQIESNRLFVHRMWHVIFKYKLYLLRWSWGGNPVGKIAEKAVRRSVFLTTWHCVFLTTWHCILSAKLIKNALFRTVFFFREFAHWEGSIEPEICYIHVW